MMTAVEPVLKGLYLPQKTQFGLSRQVIFGDRFSCIVISFFAVEDSDLSR